MVLFWSWQSDIDPKISKLFVQNSLKKAMEEINLEVAIEVPIRIDQDTKDVLGSPDIVETIFNKIEKSNVFVADVTPVSEVLNTGKKIMNPNVAIEMGYAISELGYEKVITIFNENFGSLKDLPFDIRNRRGGITYNLKQGATKEEIKLEEIKLVKKLKFIIKKYQESFQSELTTDLEEYDYKFGLFFDKTTPLFSREKDPWGEDRKDIFFLGDLIRDSYLYFKINLLEKRKFKKKELRDVIYKQGDSNYSITPIAGSLRWSPEINKFGAIVVSDKDPGITDFIQLFTNGSIVGISTSLIRESTVSLQFIKRELERAILQSISIIKEKLNYSGSVKVEIGLVNNSRLYFSPPKLPPGTAYKNSKFGPLHETNFIHSKTFNLSSNEVEFHEFLLDFIDLIIDDSDLNNLARHHVWD